MPDNSFEKLTFINYSDEEIRHKADQLRLNSGSNSIPVDVELIAEKHLGISFTPVEFLAQQVHCEALLTSTLDEIVYNQGGYIPRLRFSIAHEIGHLSLHSELIKSLKCNSLSSWVSFIETIPITILGPIEQQADSFAAHLLMPLDEIQTCLRNNRDIILFNSPDLPANLLIENWIAPFLSDTFDVSTLAMQIRLEKNRSVLDVLK